MDSCSSFAWQATGDSILQDALANLVRILFVVERQTYYMLNTEKPITRLMYLMSDMLHIKEWGQDRANENILFSCT